MDIAKLSVNQAIASLRSSLNGLSSDQVQQRQTEFGKNALIEITPPPLWLRFCREFTHLFALILWLAAGLAFFAELQAPAEGMWQLGCAIVAVIFINGIFSFWQAHRAEQAMLALKQLLPLHVKAMRNGVLCSIHADELVPGDVLALEEGDNVPADCRLIEGNDVRVNTAIITGESLPKARSPEAVVSLDILETRNLLLAGTSLISGQGKALVYATGMHTEFGKIAHLTQSVPNKTSHLQLEIARISKFVAILASTLGIVFFLIGLWIGLPFWANLMFAIGIIVANVPEGLLPIVTLSLAMATQRMAKQNALIKHLPVVETLGATTVICSDKTGTLTQNRMSIQQVFSMDTLSSATESASAFSPQLLANALCCHTLKQTSVAGQETWLGDPMEIALHAFALNLSGQEAPPPLGQLSFDSERRRMSVVIESGGQTWLYCKGAPEVVLDLCSTVEARTACAALTLEMRQHISQVQEQMADQGFRVLAFAFKPLGPAESPTETGLTFSGLIGLQDPPRDSVPAAIAECHQAGIKVIMVTGDHPHTALAIAREIGLVRTDNPTVMLGSRLRDLTLAQLQLALDAQEIIFARVTAEQKMRIVQALKNKGEIVAVTGDGVNDAPALKLAHIGIAMGISGTDVAKSAADMILMDDNFSTIVGAIREGRAVFENLRKFLSYILTSNIPELIPYLAFVLFKIPLPLTVIQILAVDLGTNMLPALALGAEKPDQDLMSRPPRPLTERLLSWQLLVRAYLWLGLLEAGIALAAFFYVLEHAGWHYGEILKSVDPVYQQATTACLAAIVVAQVFNVFLCRHPTESSFHFSARQNTLLLFGLATEIALILGVIYTPAGNQLFSTQPFPPESWGFILLLSGLFFGLEELRKGYARMCTSPQPRHESDDDKPANKPGNAPRQSHS